MTLSGATRMVSQTDSAEPAPSPTPQHQASAQTSRSLNIGETLSDRYIITRQLGEGGMGTIFQAMDKGSRRSGQDHFAAISG